MRRVQFLGSVLLVLAGASAQGAERHVPSEHPSIQRAIDACSSGDTVIVRPGVYRETIDFGGKDITVTGIDPSDHPTVAYTIIDADGEGSVVTFANGETSSAVLTGFTIKGGTGTLVRDRGMHREFQGAGIYCSEASPTITRNIIRDNYGPSDKVAGEGGQEISRFSRGGGICSGGGHAIITHNTIHNNSATSGGGIYGGGLIANNMIFDNTAGRGGGIYVSRGYVTNNTIVNNDTSFNPAKDDAGGNVFANFTVVHTRLNIVNNIICGASCGGGFSSEWARAEGFRYNNVWGNTPANYVAHDDRDWYIIILDGEADWTGQYGNISQDPLFVEPTRSDYHLDDDSPCIDIGDPNPSAESGETDIDGDARLFASLIDIGADEYIGYVWPSADAGADQHVSKPEPITLDGTGSFFFDANGVKAFEWTQTSGPQVPLAGAATATPTFTPPGAGEYRFELVVGDDQYRSWPDEVLVLVGNQVPVADAGYDRMWIRPGPAELNGSRSHDDDPMDRLSYTWTQMDGLNVVLEGADEVRPYFDCNETGLYTFSLVVSDGFEESEPDTVCIEVTTLTLDTRAIDLVEPEAEYLFLPNLYGTTVVYVIGEEWQDPSKWNIGYTDLKTGEARILEGDQLDARPRVDGDVVVWVGGAKGPKRLAHPHDAERVMTGIFWASLRTGQQGTLRTASDTSSYGYPAISGSKVVWTEHHGINPLMWNQWDYMPYSVCGADITDPCNPVYFTVAENVGRCDPYGDLVAHGVDRVDFVAIDGDLVVWEGDGDIFGADISNLNDIKVFPICTAQHRQYDPAVGGGFVAWTDERHDVADMYAADVSDVNDIREYEIMRDFGPQDNPVIDGSLMIYVDNSRARACCLTRHYGPLAVPLPGEYGSPLPAVDGSVIVWPGLGAPNRPVVLDAISLEISYPTVRGLIENARTHARYDYIQHAIDAASPGDTILVPEGIHREKFAFHGKAVTVTSTDPTDRNVRAGTIVTGGGQLVMAADGETEDSVLAGLTIRGGSGGILCNGSAPTIRHCDVTGNLYSGVKLWGGGHPLVTHCNIAANGLGVELGGSNASEAQLSNCLIVGNRSYGVRGGYPTLDNCTVADNVGYGLSCSLLMAANSIVYFNNRGGANVGNPMVMATYSDIQGGWPGEGNINADPLFVSRGSWTEAGQWVPGDYHLKSQGWSWNTVQSVWAWDDATSLCIDAGNPSLSLGDEIPCEAGDPLSERASNARVNMGAYGGTAEASLAPLP